MRRPSGATFVLTTLFLLMVSGAVGVVPGHAGRGADYGYTAEGGQIPPVDWGDLSRTCQTGKKQSPIALSTFETLAADGISAPEIHYGTSDLVVFNNGHTIEAEVEEGAGEIAIDGTTFELAQFHIHYSSEHMVDGNLYFAELHLVHRDKDDNLAVLGSLLQQGEKNTNLNRFFRAARRVPNKDDEHEVHGYNLNKLIPRGDTGYYHYSGSLTTPPCSEGVSWWVFDTSRTISRSQLDDIKVGIPKGNNPQGNRRPVQDRNRRPIYHVDG